MASRRELKKDIKFVLTELATECYVKKILFPTISDEQIASVFIQIQKLNYDLVGRINNADGKENKEVTRKFYKKLIEDYYKGVDAIFSEIDQLGK